MSLLVVGSIALDDVTTRHGRKSGVLGGSCSYFSLAASNFTDVRMVGVVGEDFPEEYVRLFEDRGIDLTGLERRSGKTFFWRGEYTEDFSSRTSLQTDLNVFAEFDPQLPESYTNSDFVFLANIHPQLQLRVLEQCSPKFVAADTMKLWIDTELDALKEVISRVNLVTVNDLEVRLISGEDNLVRGVKKILDMGPDYVILKKGEHGAMLVGSDVEFFAPAVPLDDFRDPTGAGDTFAGGFMGHLASRGGNNPTLMKSAMFYGTIMASFTVEDFSVERLIQATERDIMNRYQRLLRLTQL